MHIPFAPPGPLCSLAQNTPTPLHTTESAKKGAGISPRKSKVWWGSLECACNHIYYMSRKVEGVTDTTSFVAPELVVLSTLASFRRARA